jgi:predicted RNA-binding protein with PIN domain
MSLIIDGYNLLYAAGIGGQWETEDSFEQDRLALLESLRSVIDPRELSRTTVVFDSKQSLPHLPRAFHHREIEVRFSYGYADADELIERMIQEHTSPKRLMVVSSDHRVQRAARRRKASTMDSDAWFRWMLRRRQERRDQSAVEIRPKPALAEGEVAQWLKFFGNLDQADLAELEASSSDPRWETPKAPSGSGLPPSEKSDAAPESQSEEGNRAAGEFQDLRDEKPDDESGMAFSDDYIQRIVAEFFQEKPQK